MGQATEGRHTRVQALVLRSSKDETTFAIVKVKKTKQVQRSSQLLPRFMHAATEWIKETVEGQKAFEGSGKDYNIGDLANDVHDASLRPFLERHGLFDVEIDLYSDDDCQDNWVYDAHLVDEVQLEV